MVSYALEKGFDVLKKNKSIFIPFIIFGIISILSFLLVAKPMFEISSYQSSYSSTAFYTSSGGYDSYFFKKFMDSISVLIIYSLFISLIIIFANVAGLKAVKDYLNGQKTKISDMGKTIFSKGFTAIFAILAADVLFFFPAIAGIMIFLFALVSAGSYSSVSSISGIVGIMFIAFVVFFIQAIILLVFGYYILSKKFRKIYLALIIGIVILFIFSFAISAVSPVLSLIFIIPLIILFLVLCFALFFIAAILLYSITYIIPSAIVLEENINLTDAIKKSINFAKDNTKKFSFLVLIVFVMETFISIPESIISLVQHPSFSLFVIGEIFTIVLGVIVYPYILSIFAVAYAEAEKKNEKVLSATEEIKSKSSENSGLSGGLNKV